MNREELAWAAGFFDGEGTTSAFMHVNRWQIQLAVSQNNLDTLERFQAAVHGVGKIYGPYDRNRKNPIYTYKIGGYERVQAVISMLWPWLTPHKKEQAATALLRYLNTWKPRWTEDQRLEAKRKRAREWARKQRSAA